MTDDVINVEEMMCEFTEENINFFTSESALIDTELEAYILCC